MLFKTKRVKRYKEGFKQEVVSQVMGGLMSKSEAASKYGVCWMSVDRWCRSYGVSGVEYVGLPLDAMKNSIPKVVPAPLPDDVGQLKQRLREAEVRLRAAELRAEAAETMINIAEKNLGLDIRKKFVTKPSQP